MTPNNSFEADRDGGAARRGIGAVAGHSTQPLDVARRNQYEEVI
jgi:hypothetical protein